MLPPSISEGGGVVLKGRESQFTHEGWGGECAPHTVDAFDLFWSFPSQFMINQTFRCIWLGMSTVHHLGPWPQTGSAVPYF